MRARKLVKRGAALCVWDGARYVKVFSGRRSRLAAGVVDLSAVVRDGFFGEPLSGMDAPYLMPAGSMKALEGVIIGWVPGGVVPSVVVRPGE